MWGQPGGCKASLCSSGRDAEHTAQGADAVHQSCPHHSWSQAEVYPKTHHHRAQYPGWEQQEDQRRLCCAWETFSSLLTTCKPFSKEFLKIGSTLRTYLLNTINFLGFVKSKLGIIATESIPGKQPIARTVCATEGERKEPFRFILGLVPLQVKF